MILLFLILVIVIALLLFRSQSRRQHRELIGTLAPEKLAELERIERGAQRAFERRWLIAIAIIVGIGFLIHACGRPDNQPNEKPKTEQTP